MDARPDDRTFKRAGMPVDVVRTLSDYLQRSEVRTFRSTDWKLSSVDSTSPFGYCPDTSNALNNIAAHHIFSQTASQIIYTCSPPEESIADADKG